MAGPGGMLGWTRGMFDGGERDGSPAGACGTCPGPAPGLAMGIIGPAVLPGPAG